MLAVCRWIWGCQSGKLPQSLRKQQMNFRLPVYTMRIKFKCGNPIQTLCSDSFCASRNWKSTKDRENDWNSFINLRDDLTAWLTSLTSTSCMSLLSQRMQASLSSCVNLARFCSSWGGHHDITFEYFWTAYICAKCDDDIIAFKGKKTNRLLKDFRPDFQEKPGKCGSTFLLSQWGASRVQCSSPWKFGLCNHPFLGCFFKRRSIPVKTLDSQRVKWGLAYLDLWNANPKAFRNH